MRLRQALTAADVSISDSGVAGALHRLRKYRYIMLGSDQRDFELLEDCLQIVIVGVNQFQQHAARHNGKMSDILQATSRAREQ